MADFCKQCSEDMFGEDFGDFRAIGLAQARVLCEGCGPNCVVDFTGECVSATCLKQHGKRDGPQDDMAMQENELVRLIDNEYLGG